jgi:parvulin-like peptidyl-prolyl isomerase
MKGKLCGRLIIAGLLLALGCGSKQESAENKAKTAKEEPQYVTVQHILIGFTGSVPGRAITRTQAEAKELAEDLLARAKSGEDFDALVKEYTDDTHPGIYKMANIGATADTENGVYPRERMVQSFGDVGFSLEVGGIGLAVYDPEKSKYGYHIIKRIE